MARVTEDIVLQPTWSVPTSTIVHFVPWWKIATADWIGLPCGSLPLMIPDAHSFESIATLKWLAVTVAGFDTFLATAVIAALSAAVSSCFGVRPGQTPAANAIPIRRMMRFSVSRFTSVWMPP